MLWTHTIWKQCPCNALQDMLCYDFSHFLPPKKILYCIDIWRTTHNQLSARVDSQINFSVIVHGLMQDLPRGPTIFFWGGGLATRGIATRLLVGFGFMLPRKTFLNGTIWCVLGHIFIIFLLSKSLKISFLYKNNYKL